MKSVGMIAYFFPPEACAGTFRTLRFARQLSKVGWRPFIISARPYRYERYDPALLHAIPAQIEVTRVPFRDPWQRIQAWRNKRIQKNDSRVLGKDADELRAAYHRGLRPRVRDAVRFIEGCYYHPDMARPWIRPAVRVTAEICARERPHVLWATAGPVSAWLVAQKASELTGIPYVLDLRDPHALGYYEAEERWPDWIRDRVRRAMYGTLSNAQAVVFLFESVAECYLRAFPGALDCKRIHIIPNGYEGEIQGTMPQKGDRCTVLYGGTISTYRYDTLLESLVSLKRQYPEKASLLRLCFVGEGSNAVSRDAAGLGISDLVEASAPVSQTTIAALQQKADALLLLGRPPLKGYELVAGAKLFDYLKARRPIIAVLPEDEGKKILQRTGVETVADVNSQEEISTVLLRVIDAWSCGCLNDLLPDRASIDVYSARNQTVALVRALDGVPPETPFIDGSAPIPPSLQNFLDQAWNSRFSMPEPTSPLNS